MTGFVIFKHPEIKENEWLFCNVEKGKEWTIAGNKHRFGKIAYNNMGYEMSGCVPVFIKNRHILRNLLI